MRDAPAQSHATPEQGQAKAAPCDPSTRTPCAPAGTQQDLIAGGVLRARPAHTRYSPSRTSAHEETTPGRRQAHHSVGSSKDDMGCGLLLRSCLSRNRMPEVRALRTAAARSSPAAARAATALSAGSPRSGRTTTGESDWGLPDASPGPRQKTRRYGTETSDIHGGRTRSADLPRRLRARPPEHSARV